MMNDILKYLQLPTIFTLFGVKNLYVHASLSSCLFDEVPSLPHPNQNIVDVVNEEMKKDIYDGYKMCDGVKQIYREVKDMKKSKHFMFISVYHKKIDDIGFRLIVSMIENQRIEDINFTGCGITDYMMSLLLRCDFMYVKSLILENNPKITSRGIIHLLLYRNLNLEYLNISGTSVDKYGIELITKSSKLKKMEFFHFNFKYKNPCGIEGEWFRNMKKLKRIVCRKIDIDVNTVPSHIQCVSTPFY